MVMFLIVEVNLVSCYVENRIYNLFFYLSLQEKNVTREFELYK